MLWVAEVKSLTAANEDNQLRLGLGQVLDYRCQYEAMKRWELVSAVLVVERVPSELRWEAVCEAVGVTLAWPSKLARGLST
jgi:hypothetical protein